MGSAAPQSEMHGDRDLRVWRMAMALVTDIYEITTRFPKHQVFALANQMQRAAYSVPSNIAEGMAETRGGSSTSHSVFPVALCLSSRRRSKSPGIWDSFLPRSHRSC